MDEAFFLRARRLLDGSPPERLDYFQFVAEVVARQAACPASIVGNKVNDAGAAPVDADTVTRLILGKDGWRSAARDLDGCFNRAAARRRVNTV